MLLPENDWQELVVPELRVVNLPSHDTAFPLNSFSNARLFVAFETSTIGFSYDHEHKVRALNLLQHPHWPTIWRTRLENVDNGIEAIFSKIVRETNDTWLMCPVIFPCVADEDFLVISTIDRS